MTHDGIVISARQRAQFKRALETPGVPPLPSDSKVAADLTDAIDTLTRVAAEARDASATIRKLEADRRLAKSGNTRAMAASLAAGEDAPVGQSSVPQIDRDIEAARIRQDAARLATTNARSAITDAVKADADAFDADLAEVEDARRIAVIEAVDALEDAFSEWAEAQAARAWVRSGAAASGGGVASPSIPINGTRTALDGVLAGLRDAFRQRPAPRPTKDPDGTGRVGWEAFGKLASGERAIGVGTRRE